MVKVGVRVSNVVDLRPGGRTAMISLEFDPTLLALAQARACVDEAFRGVVTTGPLATSGGDWEGSGVKPDVPCAAPEAMRRAHQLAVTR